MPVLQVEDPGSNPGSSETFIQLTGILIQFSLTVRRKRLRALRDDLRNQADKVEAWLRNLENSVSTVGIFYSSVDLHPDHVLVLSR